MSGNGITFTPSQMRDKAIALNAKRRGITVEDMRWNLDHGMCWCVHCRAWRKRSECRQFRNTPNASNRCAVCKQERRSDAAGH